MFRRHICRRMVDNGWWIMLTIWLSMVNKLFIINYGESIVDEPMVDHNGEWYEHFWSIDYECSINESFVLNHGGTASCIFLLQSWRTVRQPWLSSPMPVVASNACQATQCSAARGSDRPRLHCGYRQEWLGDRGGENPTAKYPASGGNDWYLWETWFNEGKQREQNYQF